MNPPVDPVRGATVVDLFANSRVRGAPPGGPARGRLGAFSPSATGDEELRWFFNEAEIAIDQPSNFQGMLCGDSPTSLQAVERRAEAVHAANKIGERLRRLRPMDAQLLAGLYTERPWSRAVTLALPGGLAGAACVSVPVGAAYTRARGRLETRARDVSEFVEEVVRKGRGELIACWRNQVQVGCSIAIRAYERVSRGGPSVVPEEDE
jgi:hypothetical protein